MNVLGLIPARGGSKRIPNKNTRYLSGKPLLAWSIEQALETFCISRVVVSTEDKAIAEVAAAWGAEVPFLRPSELARDDSPGIDPVLHAIEFLGNYEWVVLLQPTSPLRRAEDVDAAFDLVTSMGGDSIVSVVEDPWGELARYQLNADGNLYQSVRPLDPSSPSYILNGAVYIARTSWLLRTRTFMTNETLAWVMPLERSVDIDNEIDWQFAELLKEKATR